VVSGSGDAAAGAVLDGEALLATEVPPVKGAMLETTGAGVAGAVGVGLALAAGAVGLGLALAAGAIEIFTLFGLIPNFSSVWDTASDKALSKLSSEDGSSELPRELVPVLPTVEDTLLS
jgi:hypothetical protein